MPALAIAVTKLVEYNSPRGQRRKTIQEFEDVAGDVILYANVAGHPELETCLALDGARARTRLFSLRLH